MTRAEPPFFVVGCPRSGTKMLRELMNRSPDLWMSDVESNFIPRLTTQIAGYGDLSERRNFDRLAEAIEATRAWAHWVRRGIRIDRDEWYRTCRTYDWRGVLEGLFHCIHRLEIPDPPKPWEQVLWGDKTPLYMFHVRELAALYPTARFVHIIRDPRDCALSSERAWGNHPLRTAQEWADRIRACRSAGLPLGPERYLEMRYEDLVADVAAKLGAIFDFLGVPTPADAGTFLRVPENLGGAKGAGKVVAENRQKWKRAMPPEQRRGIESLTGDLLSELGYEREYPDEPQRSLSTAQLQLYRVRDAWSQLKFRRRELGGWIAGLRFLLARA